MTKMSIQPVGFACGARVTGVDLSASPSENDIRAIHTAWLKHLVLVFPDQSLDPGTLVEFTRRFGEFDDYATQPFARHPDINEVMVLTNKRTNGQISKTQKQRSELAQRSLLHAPTGKGHERVLLAWKGRRSVVTPCSPTCTWRTKACHRRCERFSTGARRSTARV